MKRSQTPPPLVMIPGHLLTSELWKQQEQHLTPHYPCILPKIPEAETIREMASMILDQIPESFFLAGLSMGGMIALEILNIASERVLKLASRYHGRPGDDGKKQAKNRVPRRC